LTFHIQMKRNCQSDGVSGCVSYTNPPVSDQLSISSETVSLVSGCCPNDAVAGGLAKDCSRFDSSNGVGSFSSYKRTNIGANDASNAIRLTQWGRVTTPPTIDNDGFVFGPFFA